MLSCGSPSASDRSSRRPYTPWQCDHTSTLSLPVHCANAQDGAMEAWAMKGREYWRLIVRATCAGAVALRSSTVLVSAGAVLSQSASRVSSGRP
jgi:hypothetical protein